MRGVLLIFCLLMLSWDPRLDWKKIDRSLWEIWVQGNSVEWAEN